MKLLMCHTCGDIFNLAIDRLKSCSCGQVKGKYLPDASHAVVNGNGFSLAMGTGSIWRALSEVPNMKEDWRKKIDAWARHPTTIICWARPHDGPANSHTTIDPNL